MGERTCQLLLGRDYTCARDGPWVWAVTGGRFVSLDGTELRGGDVCVLESARLGGGRPFRIAINASVADEIAAGILAYCKAFEDHGADVALGRSTPDHPTPRTASGGTASDGPGSQSTPQGAQPGIEK